MTMNIHTIDGEVYHYPDSWTWSISNANRVVLLKDEKDRTKDFFNLEFVVGVKHD